MLACPDDFDQRDDVWWVERMPKYDTRRVGRLCLEIRNRNARRTTRNDDVGADSVRNVFEELELEIYPLWTVFLDKVDASQSFLQIRRKRQVVLIGAWLKTHFLQQRPCAIDIRVQLLLGVCDGIGCAHRKSFREIVSRPAHPDQPAAHDTDCFYVEIIFHIFLDCVHCACFSRVPSRLEVAVNKTRTTSLAAYAT